MQDAPAARIAKVDLPHRLVLGWAIICKRDGEPYYDLQGDYIDEEVMFGAAAGFMANSRVAGEMHKSVDIGDKKKIGEVVFAWPMTEEIGEGFGFATPNTGLMIGMRVAEGPDGDEVLNKFASGEYTGFSIEGRRLEQELVDEGRTETFDKGADTGAGTDRRPARASRAARRRVLQKGSVDRGWDIRYKRNVRRRTSRAVPDSPIEKLARRLAARSGKADRE